jgi:hypothetical protein
LLNFQQPFFLRVNVGRYSEATIKLEEAFSRAIPAAKKKKQTKADWTNALGQFNAEARAVRTHYKLGIIGRAMVAYRLQRRLIASGYPPDVVRQLLFSMLLNAFIG